MTIILNMIGMIPLIINIVILELFLVLCYKYTMDWIYPRKIEWEGEIKIKERFEDNESIIFIQSQRINSLKFLNLGVLMIIFLILLPVTCVLFFRLNIRYPVLMGLILIFSIIGIILSILFLRRDYYRNIRPLKYLRVPKLKDYMQTVIITDKRIIIKNNWVLTKVLSSDFPRDSYQHEGDVLSIDINAMKSINFYSVRRVEFLFQKDLIFKFRLALGTDATTFKEYSSRFINNSI